MAILTPQELAELQDAREEPNLPPSTSSGVVLTPDQMSQLKAREDPTGRYAPDVTIEEMHPGLGYSTRAGIKAFLRTPEEISRFLEREGFQTSIDTEGRVEVWTPEDEAKYRLDPSGLDVGDLFDHADDLVDFGAQTAATMTKVGGALLTAPTMGASLPLSMAAGGAVTGAAETGMQGLGLALGFRDDMNPGAILGKTVAGATIPGLQAGAKIPIVKDAIAAGVKRAKKIVPSVLEKIDWKKMMRDSPENLAKALSHDPKLFLEDNPVRNLPALIKRVTSFKQRVGDKGLEKEIFQEVKNNKELFQVAKEQKSILGEKLSKWYGFLDESVLPAMKPGKKGFTIEDFERRFSAWEKQLRAGNKRADIVAAGKKAVKKIRKDFENKPIKTFQDIWELRRSYDAGISHVKGPQDFAGKRAHQVNVNVADFYRSFLNETSDKVVNHGHVGAAMKQASADGTESMLPSLLLPSAGGREGVERSIKDVNRLYGDLTTLEHLSDIANAFSTSGASLPTLYSPIFGELRFGYYTGGRILTSPYGRYLRHRVATGKTVPQVAISNLKETFEAGFNKHVPRQLREIKNWPGLAVQKISEHPKFMDLLERTGYGVASEQFFDAILEGPEEAAAQTLGLVAVEMPELFEPPTSGFNSEIDMKLQMPEHSISYGKKIEAQSDLDPGQRVVMKAALYKHQRVIPAPSSHKTTARVQASPQPILAEETD